MGSDFNVAGSHGAAVSDAAGSPISASLLHALQAHQRELELQNHELRRTQLELVGSRDRYRDLYDRAPVGYLTLDSRGRILEFNQTAARLLDHATDGLARRPLSAFMMAPDADRWHLFLEDAFRQAAPWRIELRFRRRDGHVLECQLDGLQAARSDEPASLRVTLTDITLHRLAEANRRAALQVVAGQEADRHRVARELHDDLGQRLSALKMNLATRAPAAVSETELAAMLQTLDEAVASVRRMAGDLRPLMLDDLGLAAAVESLARRSARQYGVKLRLRMTAGDPAPGDPAAVTLYRLLQACLPLLAGQPGLGSLRIDLCDAPDARLLTMQAQRRPSSGGEPAAPGPERWTALRETAHLLGCTLAVAATGRGGERVTVRMPLPAAEPAPPG